MRHPTGTPFKTCGGIDYGTRSGTGQQYDNLAKEWYEFEPECLEAN